jgi:hypothetical protein
VKTVDSAKKMISALLTFFASFYFHLYLHSLISLSSLFSSFIYIISKGRGSAVDIATGKTEGSEFYFRRSKIFAYMYISSRPALGSTQHPIQCVPEAPSPGGKAAEA